MYWTIVNFFATTKHKLWVAWYLLRACWALVKRAWVHDLSKYSRQEAPYFAKSLKSLKHLTYGSAEYHAAIKKLGPALEHHYRNNSHHPEYFSRGLHDMTPLDLIEMICDWRAATRRHKDGSLHKSFDHNRDRHEAMKFYESRLARDAYEIGLMD